MIFPIKAHQYSHGGEFEGRSERGVINSRRKESVHRSRTECSVVTIRLTRGLGLRLTPIKTKFSFPSSSGHVPAASLASESAFAEASIIAANYGELTHQQGASKADSNVRPIDDTGFEGRPERKSL